MDQPHDAYVPTSADEDDWVSISASASMSILHMTEAEKRAAAKRIKKRNEAGGFGFGRATNDA